MQFPDIHRHPRFDHDHCGGCLCELQGAAILHPFAESPVFLLADGALCRTVDNTLLFYPNARENRTYRIPDGIAAISAYAFYDCDLLESVVIPDSITQIPERAFYGCSALASVSLPDSLTEIGIAAFSFCAALTDIRPPRPLRKSVLVCSPAVPPLRPLKFRIL